MLFPTPSAQPENRPPNPVLVGSVIIMLLGILIVMPAFFVFIAVTMAPTWILAMRGSQTDSLSLQTMGAANFAGVLPYLIKLFQKGDTFSVAVSLLFQINTIVVVSAAATTGAMLLWLGPMIAARVMTFANQREAESLARQNAEMLDTWSEDFEDDAERMRTGRYQD